jgi:hypothetical protein
MFATYGTFGRLVRLFIMRFAPIVFVATLFVDGCVSNTPPRPHDPSTAALPPAPTSAPPTVTKETGPARINLATRKSVHFLGENVLVDFCVVNVSDAPLTIDVGGDYRGSPRSLRFKVEVRDASGAVMPDPDPDPMNFGGLGYAPVIAVHEKWCQSLQLARYARIDAPGTYTITATHDLGWKGVRKAPTGTTTVAFAMPSATEAEHVIATMESLPDDPSTSAGKTAIAYADFSALRYEIYLAPLAQRAQRGLVRAIEGLSEIPTISATRVLVTLLGHADAKIAHQAAQALAMRLPDPALAGALGPRNPFENAMSEPRKYLSSHGWDASLADPVRLAARARLASHEVRDQQDGAFMLEAVGTTADGPDLVKALDTAIERTRTEPAEADVYPVPRGACQELLRAADMLVARGLGASSNPTTPGDIAVWLVALKRGAQPKGWETILERAMKHPIAYVRQLALERAPDASPASFIPTVALNLRHADVDVVVSAAELARRAHFTTLAGDVVRAMDTPIGLRLNIISNAAWTLGARFARMQALVRRLAAKESFEEAISELTSLLEHQGSSTNGETGEPERKALAIRWQTFVLKHRADIEADRHLPLTNPDVTPDLLPKSWKLGRGDGTEWP